MKLASVSRATSTGVLGVLLAASLQVPAEAHHSFAQFDMSKRVTLNGTVRAFEWTNPHVWVWLNVPGPNGTQTTWGFEGAAPGEMARQGWSRTALKPGDKITLNARPLRDGRNGGSLTGKITFADGHTLGSDLPGAGAKPGPAATP